MTITIHLQPWVPCAASAIVAFVAGDLAFGYLLGIPTDHSKETRKARYLIFPLIAVALAGFIGAFLGVIEMLKAMGFAK